MSRRPERGTRINAPVSEPSSRQPCTPSNRSLRPIVRRSRRCIAICVARYSAISVCCLLYVSEMSRVWKSLHVFTRGGTRTPGILGAVTPNEEDCIRNAQAPAGTMLASPSSMHRTLSAPPREHSRYNLFRWVVRLGRVVHIELREALMRVLLVGVLSISVSGVATAQNAAPASFAVGANVGYYVLGGEDFERFS